MGKGMDKQEKPGQPHRWSPGFCPNPKGRPRGSKNKPPQIGKEVELVASQMVATKMSGEQMLAEAKPKIVASMIALALHCDDYRLRVKCLQSCFDRLIPVLKVVDMRHETFRRVHELKDPELWAMMVRMHDLAQYKEPGGVNGGEPVLIEGNTSQGEPGNQNQGET